MFKIVERNYKSIDNSFFDSELTLSNHPFLPLDNNFKTRKQAQKMVDYFKKTVRYQDYCFSKANEGISFIGLEVVQA